jgi:hypothetical protein
VWQRFCRDACELKELLITLIFWALVVLAFAAFVDLVVHVILYGYGS